jgi:hypothetical protein
LVIRAARPLRVFHCDRRAGRPRRARSGRCKNKTSFGLHRL